MDTIVIILLVGLLITLWVQWWLGGEKKKDSAAVELPPPKRNDTLEKLVNMMQEERDQKAREAKENELRNYALKKRHDRPPAPIQSSLMHEEGPVRGGREYIPYGLSEDEKRTLKDFYNQV